MAPGRPSVPRLADPTHLQPPSGRASEEFDERFLLTPPAIERGSQNPFDQASISNSLNQSPTHMSKMLEQNAQAYWHNAQATANRDGSPPGSMASNLLQGLQLKTDLSELRRSGSGDSTDSEWKLRTSTSAGSLPLRVPSIRNRLHSTAGSASPGNSVISSPMIAAMLDITPLPSPTMGPTEWRNLMRTRSRASSTSSRASRSDFGTPLASQGSPRKKTYGILHTHRKSSMSEDITMTDESARSVSDYVPEIVTSPKPRQVAVSGTGPSKDTFAGQRGLHREGFLGVQRGITSAKPQFTEPFGATKPLLSPPLEDESAPKQPKVEVWTAQSVHTGTTKAYEMIRPLGQGTFSKVYLAVRQVHDRKDSVDYRQPSRDMAGVRARSRRLVAIKVVEPGPAGGADAERIEISLRREVELMKMVLHPSIIHLKAFGTESNGRALLIMNYCPGGDLFDLASNKSNILTPSLIRRIFSELVSAVRYLHQKFIVHRDIKLENVLLNIPVEVHGDVSNWQTLDRAVVTLTDLGLSRTIPQPPESPLLETRCGSEDYAAPEILMGQPYDGRQTDAWALGVLLYALMEGRLPFDPVPGARGDPAVLRARTPHRIARCEWQWVKYGDEDGDWDNTKGKELKGACDCVDDLLKRSTRRKALAEIRERAWVRDGIQVDGGLRWVEEEGM